MVNKRHAVIILFAWGLSLAAGAQEETPSTSGETTETVKEVQYVTDKLRLSLYKQADERSGTLKLLVSGDEVGILEKAGPYSRVRTSEGDIGWVKNGFLVSQPTASYQLIEEQKKNRILAQQIEKFSDTEALVQDYENTIEKMNEDFRRVQDELVTAQESLTQLTESNAELNQQLDNAHNNIIGWSDVIQVLQSFWYIVALIGMLIFLVGFVAGREIIEARVRRRFQGVKVW